MTEDRATAPPAPVRTGLSLLVPLLAIVSLLLLAIGALLGGAAWLLASEGGSAWLMAVQHRSAEEDAVYRQLFDRSEDSAPLHPLEIASALVQQLGGRLELLVLEQAPHVIGRHAAPRDDLVPGEVRGTTQRRGHILRAERQLQHHHGRPSHAIDHDDAPSSNLGRR